MSVGVKEQIAKYLIEARRRLVDTGRRNKLIHTARDAKRTTAINIIDGEADTIYPLLKQQTEKLNFRAVDADGPLKIGTQPPVFETDLKTSLSPEVLQRRLLKLYREAKSAEEEQGTNILFLAIGFLKWFESPNSEESCEAPLILAPVTLVREKAGWPAPGSVDTRLS